MRFNEVKMHELRLACREQSIGIQFAKRKADYIKLLRGNWIEQQNMKSEWQLSQRDVYTKLVDIMSPMLPLASHGLNEKVLDRLHTNRLHAYMQYAKGERVFMCCEHGKCIILSRDVQASKGYHFKDITNNIILPKGLREYISEGSLDGVVLDIMLSTTADPILDVPMDYGYTVASTHILHYSQESIDKQTSGEVTFLWQVVDVLYTTNKILYESPDGCLWWRPFKQRITAIEHYAALLATLTLAGDTSKLTKQLERNIARVDMTLDEYKALNINYDKNDIIFIRDMNKSYGALATRGLGLIRVYGDDLRCL